MALRTCPMCQNTAEPKMDGERELCSKCDLELPPPNMKLPDPPPRPQRKTVTARREKEWTPRRAEEAANSKKIGGFGLGVLLLVVAFVLLALFYTAVIFVKTKTTTPTTKPITWGTNRFNGNPNDPWGGQFKE